MGQQDVYEWLRKQRLSSDGWFTTPDIKKGLAEEGLTDGAINGVSSDVMRLALFNQIQWKGVGWWKHQKMFRAKKR